MKTPFFPILRARSSAAAFTLLEVIVALLLLGMLSAAVYTITSSALESSKIVAVEQTDIRRIEAFVRVTREAFLALPAQGKIFLRFSRGAAGAPVPELVFEGTPGIFGMASLGGGSLVLAARPRSDGRRTMALLLVPPGVQGWELERLTSSGYWLPLITGVERVRWRFLQEGEWKEEWLEGAGRPQAVELTMGVDAMPDSGLVAIFWIPPLADPNLVAPAVEEPETPEGEAPEPTPEPEPEP